MADEGPISDFDAALVKRKMMQNGKQAVAVADSSKLGQVAFACVAALSAADLLITDAGSTQEDRQELETAGLRIHIA